MKLKHVVMYSLLVLLPLAFSGCWYAAAAGAGAYGGYKMKEKGYKVQSPVEKESPKRSEEDKKDSK
jgi:hypothetical protein